MPLYLIEETIDDAAQVIADRLRRLADGPLTCPETWQGVSSRLNCRTVLYEAPGGGKGEFCPGPYPGPPSTTGVIAINAAYPDPDQCRAWVHELSHALLHLWHPPQMDEARDSWHYEGDPDDIHHKIARRVEALIFGL